MCIADAFTRKLVVGTGCRAGLAAAGSSRGRLGGIRIGSKGWVKKGGGSERVWFLSKTIALHWMQSQSTHAAFFFYGGGVLLDGTGEGSGGG
jgi:hypothetical protein